MLTTMLSWMVVDPVLTSSLPDPQSAWYLRYGPAAATLLIGVVTIAANLFIYRLSRQENRRSRRESYRQNIRPALTFVRRSEKIWILLNAGQGTAFNITLRDFGTDALASKTDLYPLLPQEEVELPFLEKGQRLVAEYTNMYGRDPRHTVCQKNKNVFKRGPYREDGTFGHRVEADRRLNEGRMSDTQIRRVFRGSHGR